VPLTQFDLRAVSASNNLYSTGTVVLSGGANVTVGTNAQTITIAAAAQSVQTQSLFSGGVSNLGNTAGSTGVSGTRMVLVGSQNVTLSQSTDANGNTISLSAAGGGAGAFSAGASSLGNTAGSTGVTGTRLVLVGTNAVSLSQSTDANGGTLSINVATQTVQTQDVLSAGVSTGGNTAGNTTVNTGSRLVLAGAGMVTLSQATGAGASTITVSATQSGYTASMWPAVPNPIATSSMISGTSGSTGGSTQTTAHFYIAPYVLNPNVTFNQIRGAISGAISAGTGSISAAHYLGIYTLNANTALSLVSSMIFNVVASQNSQTNYTAKWWWGTDSNANSTQASGAAVSADFVGLHPISFMTGANSLPSGDYWIAHGYTHRTSGASIGGWNTAAFMNIGSTTATNIHQAFGTSVAISPLRYLGVFTTTSNATTTNLLVVPSSIHTSVISGTNAFSLWLLPNITIMST
jgi:hypothetical protein